MLKKIIQNSLFKVLSLNSISVVISFVLGIISTKIIAVFLGTQGMALLGSFRNFSSMVKLTSTSGINNALVKLYVENKSNKKELSIIFATFFWLFLGISVVLSLLAIALANPISQLLFFSDKYVSCIYFLAILVPLMVLNAFWLAIYNGLEQFKKIVIIQIIGNLCIFLISLYLIINHSFFGAILSVALAEVVLFVVTFLFVCKDVSYFKYDLKNRISRKYSSIIFKFSAMALLSAVIAPLTLILIRNVIVANFSINEAGIWDGVAKLSNFYMIIFGSGLSLYYMPKLAQFTTDFEFKNELKFYFKFFVPFVFVSLIIVFLLKDIIIQLAFTKEFNAISDVLIWQLAGDFVRLLTLAFGYQIVIKTMVKEYFFLEVIYNIVYFLFAFYLVKQFSFEGALQAYFYANILVLLINLFIFRRLFFKSA